MVYVLPHKKEFDDFYSCIGYYVKQDPIEIRNSLISHYKIYETNEEFLRKTYKNSLHQRFALDFESLKVNVVKYDFINPQILNYNINRQWISMMFMNLLFKCYVISYS